MGRQFSKKSILVAAIVASGILPSLASAEPIEFGGYKERMKGAGDKVPPLCGLDLPKGSTEPFFVKWSCTDNFTKSEDIRTELWIYRNGAPAGQLFANFLGFPASVFIDQGALNVEEFGQGLPVGFRLLAKDKAGNESISATQMVHAQDNSLSGCDLQIITEATESSGSTTGTPALTVHASNAPITVTQSSETALNISASSIFAQTCEITSVCSNERVISFSAALTLGEENSAKGSVSVSPGNVTADVEGTASAANSALQSLAVEGSTTIDGADAKVTLNCQK